MPFWPLLCPDGRHFAPFVHAYEIIPYQNGMLLPGRSGNNLGDSLKSDSSLLAIAFDFSSLIVDFVCITLMACVTDVLLLGHRETVLAIHTI